MKIRPDALKGLDLHYKVKTPVSKGQVPRTGAAFQQTPVTLLDWRHWQELPVSEKSGQFCVGALGLELASCSRPMFLFQVSEVDFGTSGEAGERGSERQRGGGGGTKESQEAQEQEGKSATSPSQ